MNKSTKKLIIWDFDGVISDSEHLWVKNWADTLKQTQNISLNKEQQHYYLEGKAEKTKMELLTQDFPLIKFDDKFWDIIHQNEDLLIKTKLKLTKGIEKILSQTSEYDFCIATGANKIKHFKKVHKLLLEKIFTTDNSITAEDVKQGKPAPDIFLFAAQKMGYQPKDCLIIEDSLAGITAAVSAKIPVIAYIGASGNNSPEYAEKCRIIGAKYICRTMTEVSKSIQHHFNNL